MSEKESVLGRWSRRKQAAREGSADDAGEDATPPVRVAQTSAGEVPDLPDIDSLDADSDFSAFLGESVPDAVQRLALRRLWRLDPVYANLDGLIDYGEDFTDAATVIEGMKTAYRVGKGLVGDETEDGEPETEADSEDGEAVDAGNADSTEIETPDEPEQDGEGDDPLV